MSLLADLQLNYENLADDPIDRGIYYGKSVLQALTSPIQLAPAFAVEPGLTEVTAAPVFRTARPVERARVERTRYVNYATRPSFYAQRSLVGAL